jgi:dihydroorotase
MPSTPRKAPLKKTPSPTGWLIVQTRADGVALRAWARLSGMEKIQIIKSAEIPALEARARELSAPVIKIPAHWIAVPTGLDLQVHLRFPGQPQKETLAGGLESALYGGYDGLVSMPNTNPFLDTAEALRAAIESAKTGVAEYPVRVGFAASATKGMQGKEATEIDELAAAGAVAITDDGWGVKYEKAQGAIFASCARHQILFQQHAEMHGHGGVTPASVFQAKQGLPIYPRSAESDMIRRDITILRRHPSARYHVLHVSTRESLAEIRRAKDEGLKISAEATPHHLFFSNEDIPGDERSTYFKMNPPLFSPDDREALREALRDGTIDCVSTDHAPHEKELKGKGWLVSPFGTRGMETALPAIMTLVSQGVITLQRAVEVFSAEPRRVLAREEFAKPSGLLFVDPLKKFTVTTEDLPGISENSCFLGAELTGRLELRAEPGALYSRA